MERLGDQSRSRLSGIGERLSSVPDMLRPGKLRDALGDRIGRIVSSPKTIPILTGTALLASTSMGVFDIAPDWQVAVGYLQAIEPDKDWWQASWELLSSNDMHADIARRLALHVDGVQALDSHRELAEKGLPIPPGIDPDSYAVPQGVAYKKFISRALEGAPGLVEIALAGVTGLMVKRLYDRRGSESEYEPGYAQVQTAYDLDTPEIIGQIEALLADQPKKRYQMEQTYFEDEQSKEVMKQLFKPVDRSRRKQALAEIGLSEEDEIREDQFRLVTIDESPSIVLRIKREGDTIFGKKTFYADQGYPPILSLALSMVSRYPDITTVKMRTVLEREVPFTDPKTKKPGTSTTILNYDQYFDPAQPGEILHTRVEVVLAERTGVTQEDAFPEFFGVLSQLNKSELNDRKIGFKIQDKGQKLEGEV